MASPRWLLIWSVPLLPALGGCGWGDCKAHGPYELSDWSLGAHVATLSWLWTGAVTELSLTGSAGRQFESTDCGMAVPVVYELSTSDGAIDQSVRKEQYIGDDGSFGAPGLSLNFDVQPTLVARIAPELAGLAKPQLQLRLIVPRDTDYTAGELRLLTTGSDVAVATLQFRSTP